jgi:hypothetical protein
VNADTSIGIQTVTFTGVEKVLSVRAVASGSNRILEHVTPATLLSCPPQAGDAPSACAVTRMDAGSVVITLDVIPQAAFTLQADGYERADTLTGSQEPAFPESFHDILIEGVLADEYRKLEKATLAGR